MLAAQNPVKFFNVVKMNGKKFYSDNITIGILGHNV
jgi:hypothetical protein